MKISEINIYQGLGEFIKTLRVEIASLLQKKFGDNWDYKFQSFLDQDQKKSWEKAIKKSKSSEQAIDFHHLRQFAQNNEDILWPLFDKDIFRLPTWFDEIADVRHYSLHFNTDSLKPEQIEHAWDYMIWIAGKFKMNDLERNLLILKKRRKITDDELEDFQNEIIEDHQEEELEFHIVYNKETRNIEKEKLEKEDHAAIDKVIADLEKELEEKEEKLRITRLKDLAKKKLEERLKLLYPFKKDFVHDFEMVKEIGKWWLRMEDNKIIIRKEFGKIIFDFNEQTITEVGLFRRKRIVNYKDMIKNILKENPDRGEKELVYPKDDENRIVIFSLERNLYSTDKMTFGIGNKVHGVKFTAEVYNFRKPDQKEKLELFMVKLVSYICGVDIDKIAKDSHHYDYVAFWNYNFSTEYGKDLIVKINLYYLICKVLSISMY